MIEALKKLDKKFLVFAGCIILLPILLIIVLAIVQGCSNRKLTYNKYEDKMISAAKNYFEENKLLPDEEGQKVTVKLSKLVEDEYIKSAEKMLDDDSCKGEVSVRKNGSTIESNNGGFLNYTVKLECKNHKTDSLYNSLMENVTTVGSGLYEQNNSYIFKGDEPRNYITFYGVKYRILSMDSDGIVKLIKEEKENLDRYWDIKYNTEVNDSYGKNIYADSDILKQLLNSYENSKIISSKAKSSVISKDVCIGSRDINNTALYSDEDCSNVIENQVVSLINVTDFANASLDSECISITSKSCRNYNYLRGLYLESWTLNAVSNNSYQVYYLNNGVISYQEASVYLPYNIVIYIDSNQKIKSGNGTQKKPYVIE